MSKKRRPIARSPLASSHRRPHELAAAVALLLSALTSASCGAAMAPAHEGTASGLSVSLGAPAAAAEVVHVGASGLAIPGLLGPGPSGSGEVDDAGRYVARHTLRLDAGARVRLLVRARPGFDPMLRLEGPGGVSLSIDDAFPNQLDALLELTPQVAGEYVATVSSWGRAQAGAYTLEVGPAPASAEHLSLGERFDGTLGASADPAFPSVSFLPFEAQGGSVIHLRVTSQSFDTVATVLAPNGQRWQNDDANDVGSDGSERPIDSTIELSAPVSGTYVLAVSSYWPNRGGTFSVASRARPPVVVLAGETAPRGPLAGVDGAGRILGLYSGITDYPSGPLFGCADDARLLGEAFRAAHLQRVDEQIVLTDREATRDRFVAGIRELASRARPEDVVVVFFSGHGDVEPATSQAADAGASSSRSSELDGTNERIVFVDGALTDDVVVAELSNIHAAMVVLAIDACYSGGFADDWMRAPGRIGLFSSDADVLSETAQPRQAGGYLSYYLRRAVSGEADAKPRDGVLQAGELTDYLLEGMVRDHRLMNRDGSIEPSQRFVMQRGSVGWVNSLWVYPRGEDLALPSVADVIRSAP